jgi:hypothetical protein
VDQESARGAAGGDVVSAAVASSSGSEASLREASWSRESEVCSTSGLYDHRPPRPARPSLRGDLDVAHHLGDGNLGLHFRVRSVTVGRLNDGSRPAAPATGGRPASRCTHPCSRIGRNRRRLIHLELSPVPPAPPGRADDGTRFSVRRCGRLGRIGQPGFESAAVLRSELSNCTVLPVG